MTAVEEAVRAGAAEEEVRKVSRRNSSMASQSSNMLSLPNETRTAPVALPSTMSSWSPHVWPADRFFLTSCKSERKNNMSEWESI
jgi:hypothetical protein